MSLSECPVSPLDAGGNLKGGACGQRSPVSRSVSWKDAAGALDEAKLRQSDSTPAKPGGVTSLAKVTLQGLRPLADALDVALPRSMSTDKIDDRRSSPSKADHPHIVNSFQQGLDSVDRVIVYDSEQVEIQEHSGPERRCWMRMLSNCCLHICACLVLE
mmetsp:Transcript_10326/g.18396  ORF Transcript_10326/g.18396 Transcript_10326/m.18396 type:complete len:159 (-) Transcript_10326:55-531(-)